MIRRNRITGEPVILAPERAQRPDIVRGAAEECPFCPGNEAMTPPEIWRDADPWNVRLFPNKYPATERHEVIVESSRHDDTFDLIPPKQAAVVADMYMRRYRVLSNDAAYVSVFKNQGLMAGATIPHLHSQILATPFIPPRVQRESDAFARASACPLCAGSDEPLIEESAHYQWIAPQASTMAYEQWIVPKRHAREMSEADELGELLQAATRATRHVASAYNWVFMNFPRQPAAHWYVQILPRLAVQAGFELGSGTGINVVVPEDAARHLKKSS